MAKDALGHGSNGNGMDHQIDIAAKHGVPTAHLTGAPAQMTRAHFEQIASQLRSAPDAGSPAHSARVSAVADQISSSNPNFRRDLFVKASSPTGGYKDRSTRSITKTNASKKLKNLKFG